MAKQTINIGSGELAGDGETLRSAFNKANSNFNELYTTAITATGISSNLVPAANNLFDLGSSSTQWRSLYVSTNTIYLGNTPVTVLNGNLTVNGISVGEFTGTNRLINGNASVVLTGGANPYTTFPAITSGEQVFIQGSEIASSSGTLALTSFNNLILNANGSGAGGNGIQGWTFDTQGDLRLPIGGDILDSDGNSVLGGGSAVGEFSFTNVLFTTPSISNNTTSTQTISGPKAYILNKISVSTASWVRVYISSSTQQNDLLRDINVDPVSTTGIVAEAITTQSGTVVFSPGINGFNNEATPLSQIPISVTYLGAGSAAVNVSLGLIRLIS